MSIGIGDTLREAREEQGRTIEDAARDTRVRGDYLGALEDEAFEVFGGDVYAKGFLSTYARYLRLDPQPLLDSYRRHVQHDDQVTSGLASTPVGRQPSGPPPTWIAWVVIAVIVLGGIGALSQLLGSRTVEPTERPPQAVSSPTPSSEPTTETPTAEPTPEPTFDGVNLVLTFEGESWVRIEVDGEQVDGGTVRPAGYGPLELQAEDNIVIRFGNAGGVSGVLNGQPLEPFGAPGQVTTVTFTPDGATPA